MGGFFTKSETESKNMLDGKRLTCAACGLYAKCAHPKMKPFGNFKKGILNIGEAPSEIDDERGGSWLGKSGRVLQRYYKKVGINLHEDCLNINAVSCHVPPGKGPTNYQINSCRKKVFDVIKEYQPKVIVLFGNAALYSVIGGRWKRNLGTISKWRGWTIPDMEVKSWICPTFHPSYIDREFDKPEVLTTWMKDLEGIAKHANSPFPRNKKFEIKYITDLSPLRNIRSDMIAFDYEATGIKPHAPGHRIICASVAYDYDKAYSFMMPTTRKEQAPFLELLADVRIRKMAHNMKYEEAWSVRKLRQPINNWGWDSMVAAHILDNRPGITSLKFQTYVNFGIIDYESEVSPYFKSAEGGNAMNSIFDLLETPGGEDVLLKYCGLDSIYEYRLAMKQQTLLNEDFLPF